MSHENVRAAIDEIGNGRMVILVDDEDRENEGDLVCAAEHVRPDIVNFMATHGRGLICMPMTAERLRELDPSSADGQDLVGAVIEELQAR